MDSGECPHEPETSHFRKRKMDSAEAPSEAETTVIEPEMVMFSRNIQEKDNGLRRVSPRAGDLSFQEKNKEPKLAGRNLAIRGEPKELACATGSRLLSFAMLSIKGLCPSF